MRGNKTNQDQSLQVYDTAVILPMAYSGFFSIKDFVVLSQVNKAAQLTCTPAVIKATLKQDILNQERKISLLFKKMQINIKKISSDTLRNKLQARFNDIKTTPTMDFFEKFKELNKEEILRIDSFNRGSAGIPFTYDTQLLLLLLLILAVCRTTYNFNSEGRYRLRCTALGKCKMEQNLYSVIALATVPPAIGIAFLILGMFAKKGYLDYCSKDFFPLKSLQVDLQILFNSHKKLEGNKKNLLEIRDCKSMQSETIQSTFDLFPPALKQ